MLEVKNLQQQRQRWQQQLAMAANNSKCLIRGRAIQTFGKSSSTIS